MSESFNKIKRGKRTDACIQAVLIGLAAGMLTAGVLVLIAFLKERTILPIFTVLISVLISLAFSSASYAFIRKSDRALARALDREFSLREKTETMLAFCDKDGEMLTLQRKDADDALGAAAWRKPLFARFGACFIACVLSLALLVTNIVAVNINRDKPDPVIPEEEFSLSEWQIGALSTLIETVRYSDFDAALRAETVKELEALLEAVKTIDTVPKMRARVIEAIVTVDLLTENTATYKIIASALGAQEDGNTRLLAASILTLNGVGLEDNISPIRDDFANDKLYLDYIISFVDGIKEALPETSLSYEDALYDGVDMLAYDLDALLSEGITNVNVFQGRIDRIFNAAYNSIGTALEEHYANRSVRTHIIEQLAMIFAIPESEIPPLIGDVFPVINLDSDDRRPDDSGKENSGGYGSGDEKFGSNDEIYDPFGELGAGYVSYPEVYDRYQKAIRDLIAGGELDPETAEMLTQYFIRLSDGSKNNK